jgi:hypothetical protein
VVKMEVHDGPAVAANCTSAASLRDQDLPNLLVAPGHRLSNTPLASPSSPFLAGRVERKLGKAVIAAIAQLHPALSGRGRRTTRLLDERNRGCWPRSSRTHVRIHIGRVSRDLVRRVNWPRGRGPKVGQQTFNLRVWVRFPTPPLRKAAARTASGGEVVRRRRAPRGRVAAWRRGRRNAVSPPGCRRTAPQ